MRRLGNIFLFLLCAVGMLVGLPAAAQGTGVSVTCDNGSNFENGIEIIVQQMRAGFTYTATAIGINGFDPVLAVLNESGTGFCSDNAADASKHSADLPTSGPVSASTTSAQIRFDQSSGQNMADVSLVVGSVGNTTGEFVLLLEGMAATNADGAGDPFALRLTPDMVASGIPLTVYMISVTSDLDPLLMLTDENKEVIYDDDNNPIYCDDAGDAARCWGTSTPLGDSFVTRVNGRQLPGFNADAMLSIGIDGITLNSDPNLNFYHFLMTSYNQSTFGDYVLAFHMGTTSETSSATPEKGPGTIKEQPGGGKEPTPIPPSNADVPMGISVTCNNGVSFDNGVEIVVDQMRTGFNYTATAIGMNGFDPVLAVLNESGTGTCSDDANSASNYAVDLPTSGEVVASITSAQLQFNQSSGQNMADVSLVVGSIGNGSGEFILILEGMAATNADGPGDTFSVRLTPGMVASGVPLTVYMISVTNDLDPLIGRIDSSYEFLFDANNNTIFCDDAGDPSRCWGESSSLNNSFVTRQNGRALGGFAADAMLSIPIADIALDEDTDFNFIHFIMTSYNQSTFGDYLLAFHIGSQNRPRADV